VPHCRVSADFVSAHDLSLHETLLGKDHRVAQLPLFQVSNSYTLEASFAGANFGPTAGRHLTTRGLEAVGHALADALLDYYDPDQSRVADTLRELQVLYPEGDGERDGASSGEDSSSSGEDAPLTGPTRDARRRRRRQKDTGDKAAAAAAAAAAERKLAGNRKSSEVLQRVVQAQMKLAHRPTPEPPSQPRSAALGPVVRAGGRGGQGAVGDDDGPRNMIAAFAAAERRERDLLAGGGRPSGGIVAAHGPRGDGANGEEAEKQSVRVSYYQSLLARITEHVHNL